MKTKTTRKTAKNPAAATAPTKLDQLIALLKRPQGAAIADMTAATGWQQHSVRGALAGTLKKRGHIINSEKLDGVRVYRIGSAA